MPKISIKRIILTFCLLSLFFIGLYDYLTNFDENECSMTWMFQAPQLLPVRLPPAVEKQKQFERYQFSLYCERYECDEAFNFKPGHIPILFVPGNADSAMQVRSLASVAADKVRTNRFLSKYRLQYFTISFNKELTGLYGPFVKIHTEYVKHCIKHILSLFETAIKDPKLRPKSVVLIGNSLGGVISRGIFVNTATATTKDPSANNDSVQFANGVVPVHTIITKSSPHTRPIINIDYELNNYYTTLNKFWLNQNESSLQNVVLASLYGGYRDVLVRTGFANINTWQNRTSATILSAYTESMPKVWKSIDHRCMAWCRELVLQINRALFSLIDKETLQITDDLKKRTQVFEQHFINDLHVAPRVNDDDYEFLNAKLTQLANKNFEFNDFSKEKGSNLMAIDLRAPSVLNSSFFDSLFIYTNNNEAKSFMLCKSLEQHHSNQTIICKGQLDLLDKHGRSIAPLHDQMSDNKTLKLINVIDFKSKYLSNADESKNFKFLLIRIPLWPLIKSTSQISHQLVIKLDWYLKEERISDQEMPDLFNMQKIKRIHSSSSSNQSPINYRRLNLRSFNQILQAYSFTKEPKDMASSCDSNLHSLIGKHPSLLTPKNIDQYSHEVVSVPFLASSSMFALFCDPVDRTQIQIRNEHVYNTESMFTRSKPLMLRLGKNLDVNIGSSYIELIQFDVKHLVNKNQHDKLPNFQECNYNYVLTFKLSIYGILGQINRFYLLLVPSFVVFILTMSDLFAILFDLKSSNSSSSNNSSDMKKFNEFNILRHLILSVLLSTLVSVVNQLNIVSLPENDFKRIENEQISNRFLVFILYWTAFGLASLFSSFLDCVLSVVSFIYKRLASLFHRVSSFSFSSSSKFRLFAYSVYLLACFLSLYVASSVTLFLIFIGELLRLVHVNSNSITYAQTFLNQRNRILFIYLILTFNLPSLISWINIIIEFNQGAFSTLASSIPDIGFYISLYLLLSQIFFHFKLFNQQMFNLSELNQHFSLILIVLNSLAAIFYSTLNLFYLPYFILNHLIIMNFTILNKNDDNDIKEKKNKTE